LGDALLIRARPRTYASPAGQIVLDAAERIFREVNDIRQHFSTGHRGSEIGTLRVVATSLGIAYIYGDLCEAFVAKHPGIKVIFRAAETAEEAVQRVVAGSADVAFVPLPVAASQVQTILLGTTEHVFIVGRSHPLAQLNEVTIPDLHKWPFVRFQSGTGSRFASDQIFMPSGGYPAVVTESSDAEFAKRVVTISDVVALIPLFAVEREINHTVKALRMKDQRLLVDFGLIHHRNVRMRSLDLMKKLCLELCSPAKRRITLENVGKQHFKSIR
jgi:DNA-binding transcriptional LysR family regulator